MSQISAFHPHLHVLAAHGLFDDQGRFHCLPDHYLAQLTELFRHRFLHALHTAKLVSDHKIADLLSWKNSGFHVHADTDLVRCSDVKGRQRLAEYLLRAPFSLQKITWNPDTQTVIYRSRRSYHTKANFQVFTATDFLAAVVDHIPPKGQHTIRYYGLYSNRSRGSARPAQPTVLPPPRTRKPPPEEPQAAATQILLIPPPEKLTARAMRPLWRDLIQAVWAVDALHCPHCHGALRRVESLTRPEAIEFFLRLHGLWEGLVNQRLHPLGPKGSPPRRRSHPGPRPFLSLPSRASVTNPAAKINLGTTGRISYGSFKCQFALRTPISLLRPVPRRTKPLPKPHSPAHSAPPSPQTPTLPTSP